MRVRTLRPPVVATLLVVLALFAGTFALFATVPPARAASSYAPVTGAVSGPALVGVSGRGTYEVTASGGPAGAPNGTQVGIYSYRASLGGLPVGNASGAIITPSSGVLVNGSVNLSFVAPNFTAIVTVFVDVTSSYQGTNVSQNFSAVVQVIEPYRLRATLVVASGSSVSAFAVTVTLDGAPVGSVNVPTLTGGATYPLNFSYVTSGLSVGWHTFAITLAQEHGLVTFSGGQEQFSTSFYVPGPPPDYTVWYLAGTSAFVGAILILTMRVGARRRGRSKK
ncbi:MAG: hypothetical protein ACREDK_05710 [Thermoplasmata archaeon]